MNYDYVLKNVLEAHEDYSRDYDLICIVAQVLQKFEGKPFSKRMETAIKKALPLNTVYYEKTSYHIEITIWGNGVKYDKRMVVRLASRLCEDYPNFNYVDFRERNQCHFLDHERLERSKSQLPELGNAVIQFNEALETIKSIQEKFTEHPLTYAFSVEEYKFK